MPESPSPAPAATVDGTAKTCTGVIAGLEIAMQRLPDGAHVRAIVADVPTRIDVHAWAERKGHEIPSEERAAGVFQITIVKAGRARSAGPR